MLSTDHFCTTLLMFCFMLLAVYCECVWVQPENGEFQMRRVSKKPIYKLVFLQSVKTISLEKETNN